MAVREVNWLELPDHLTVLVTDKLSRCDFLRFGAVCKSWLSILIAHPRRSVFHQLPLLLISSDEGCDNVYNMYDSIEKRIYRFQVIVPYSRRCCGSSCGWLFTIWREDRTIKIILKNPLLAAPKTIKLPNLKKDMSTSHVAKAVLSANPTSNPNYVVMVIFIKPHAKLAFFMPSGDKADWTYLETNSGSLADTLYYRDQFYFVDKSGTLFACDLNHPHNPRVSPVLAPPPYSTLGLDFEEDKDKYLYLVELSSGDLLLVKRVRKSTEDGERSYTIEFSAYKMNPLVEDLKWIEVHNLCGDAVFVGANYSSSLRASDFPGCKPNCIYFAEYGYFIGEDNDSCGPDYGPDYIGIFNLEDGSIERQCRQENSRFRLLSSPIWIEPTPFQ